MMDNPRLSDAVASLLHKLEPSNLSKYKFPPDLENDLKKLKDSLPLLLDPSRTHDLSLSTDDLEHSVRRVNDLLDLHFDMSSLIVGIDEKEEKRFEELRLLISCLAPLFKSCSETTILRDTGKRYFEELLSRGIFEKLVSVLGNGNSRSVYSCELSPVVHDAARRLAAEEVAVFNTRNSDGSSSVTVGQRTKHAAFHKYGFPWFNLEKVIQNCEYTTSLLKFSSHWDPFFGGSAGQIERLDNLRRLLVLHLRQLPPIRLSSLKYLSLLPNLKRLELVGLPMVRLPDCLQFAQVLEYFTIADCPQLQQLESVKYLRSLQELLLG